MNKLVTISSVLVTALLSGTVATAQQQAQNPRTYVRSNCVKVRDGKWQEYSAYLRELTKLQKVRMDAPDSRAIGFTIGQAVSPAGRSARCDYMLVTVYSGFPPEAATPEQAAADMKKAGITMTREAMVAKRDELSFLVGVDTWVYQGSAGNPTKGGYIRINYDKVKPGMLPEWSRSQREGWGPLAELATKEHGTAWRAATLVMPGGSSLPYNAMTVDFFPSWDAVGKGIPTRALWNKAHPNRDMTAHFDQQDLIRERTRVDLMKLIEVIRK